MQKKHSLKAAKTTTPAVAGVVSGGSGSLF